MRKGLFVTGIILLIVGLLSIAYPMFIGTASSIEAYPNLSEPVAPIIGSGTFTVHWSGATSSTHIVMFQCLASDCTQLGPVLANETGASGSFSVTLQAGKSYGIFEYGTPISVPATATLMGISILVLIGIVLTVIAVIVLALSFRARAQPAEGPAPAGGTTYAAPAARAEPEATPQKGNIAARGDLSPPGTRANLTCAYCGTVNEPWITNCRKCKRPLASTSQ